MADSVDTVVDFNGTHKYIVHLSNYSDGTGETTVTKVDRSSLVGPDGVNAPSALVIETIEYDVQGFEAVRIIGNNTDSDDSDEDLAVLSGPGFNDYRKFGGRKPTKKATTLTGIVGDILLTTVGTAAAGDSYDITITFKLKV
jgi:hypothetical protein